ncbi:hypothetical protein DL98DRAFT_618363 [Cadophora sp. DSE1049]|nr:hypothetical protein DL98DRAFT_618363 [Cadophora sp. DSE1049]
MDIVHQILRRKTSAEDYTPLIADGSNIVHVKNAFADVKEATWSDGEVDSDSESETTTDETHTDSMSDDTPAQEVPGAGSEQSPPGALEQLLTVSPAVSTSSVLKEPSPEPSKVSEQHIKKEVQQPVPLPSQSEEENVNEAVDCILDVLRNRYDLLSLLDDCVHLLQDASYDINAAPIKGSDETTLVCNRHENVTKGSAWGDVAEVMIYHSLYVLVNSAEAVEPLDDEPKLKTRGKPGNEIKKTKYDELHVKGPPLGTSPSDPVIPAVKDFTREFWPDLHLLRAGKASPSSMLIYVA